MMHLNEKVKSEYLDRGLCQEIGDEVPTQLFHALQAGQPCLQLKAKPQYLQPGRERKLHLQPKARKELAHSQMCGTEEK